MTAPEVNPVKRVVLGVAALLVLAVLCLGAPLALLAWGEIDLSGLRTLGVADDGRLLLSLLTAVGWLAWLAMVIEVVTDVAHGLTHGRFRWRPATGGWIRPLTSVLVAAVLAMGLVKPSMAAAETPRAPTGVVATNITTAIEAPTPQTNDLPRHVVQPGDDLWGLAERLLGEGTQWRAIADLNPGLADRQLVVGEALVLPAGAITEASVLAADEQGYLLVRVQPGDSLWLLAEQWLGDGERWPEIHRANAALIDDPNEIEIGWQLRIPQPRLTKGLELADEVPQAAQPAPRVGSDDEQVPEPRPTATTTRTITPAPASHDHGDDQGVFTDDPVRLITGSISATLAMGIAAGLTVRRRAQLSGRALGRRVPQPGSGAARFDTALARLAVDAHPVESRATSVVVGENEHGSVLVDLGAHSATCVVAGEGEDDRHEVALDLMGGIVTSLACADWSQLVDVVVIGEGLGWAEAFDHPPLSVETDVSAGVERWRTTALARAGATEDDDSPAEIFLFSEVLDAAALTKVLTLGHPRMHAVLVQPVEGAGETIALDEQAGTIATTGEQFAPQLISEPARRALVELHRTTTAPATAPAPWWHHPAEGVLEPTPLRPRETPVVITEPRGEIVPDTPLLKLLGPIELVGTRGTPPPRAPKQCIEYCAWIHEHPGRTSAAMVQSLLVAETTRRSNTSRLRHWLGTDDEGQPFLPEAYTGRLALHPAVTSDWEQVRLKVTGGVNRAPSQTLVNALSMVRGAPLADAAPGQWHWAEGMRTDMVSTIRDIAVVLGRRAIENADLDTARWAANRALQAAPEDELLMGVKIKCEFVAGNKAEVDRLVLAVTRHARLVGIDLQEETIVLLQEVVEGQARSRQA